MYIERAVDRLIRRALRTKGAVLVTGARQVGKTLLVLEEIQESPRALTSLKFFNEKMPVV